MSSQFQIINGGIHPKTAVPIGLFLFDDFRSFVYFSKNQIEKALNENSDINRKEFFKMIETIGYEVEKDMNAPKGTSLYEYPSTDISIFRYIMAGLRFSKPRSLRSLADTRTIAGLVIKHVDPAAKISTGKSDKLKNLIIKQLFPAWSTYFRRNVVLDRRFFLGLTREYKIDYAGFNSDQLVLVKIINFENRYKLIKKQLDELRQMRYEFSDLRTMKVNVIIVSAKPEKLFSSVNAQLEWSYKPKDASGYFDISEITKLHEYAKKEKLKPLERVWFNVDCSLTEGEKGRYM